MSRIGRAPIPLPSGVTVQQEPGALRVEGPKGALALQLPPDITAAVADQRVTVSRAGDTQDLRARHGLYRALIANMVHGVATGFTKELDVVGVGYRAQVQGKQLTLHVGFSHPVVVAVPDGLTVETPKPTNIMVKGSDKHQVGQFAANIRRIAPPEPYKGKGIKYAGEVIRRKAGKAATGAGAKSGAGG